MNEKKQNTNLLKIGLLLIIVLALIPIIVHAANRLPACEYNICRMNQNPAGACLAAENGYPSTEDTCYGGVHYRCFCAIYSGNPGYCSGPENCTNNGLQGSCALTDKSCCTDECTVNGASYCSGINLMTCGQNDGDPCLELVSTVCQYGCENNACNNPPPITECGDNLDNDGDGLIDLNDPGCSNYADTTERNNDPIPRCGDGIIGIPAWGLNNNCYGIVEQCDDGNTNPGDGCSPTCQIETPTINITNIAYGYANGCNSATKICGRDSTILVTVSYPGYTAPMNTNSSVKLKNQPPVGVQECILTPTTIITSNKTNSLFYTYVITSSIVQTGPCSANPLMNTTYDSKLLLNNAPISNIFGNTFSGFRLSECGDGTVDYIPSAVPPINESCDTINPSSSTWMTSTCALVNSTHPGGTVTCNQNTCQWVMSGCYKCGDGIRNGTEQCDDGNSNNYDACNNTCQWSYCGNGKPNTPNGRPYSSSPIPPPFSGNFTEQCDDGNLIQTDTCANNCTTTFCGDNMNQTPNGRGLLGGFVWDCEVQPCVQRWGYEECDDGNTNQYDLCSDCVKTYCGDGVKQTPNGRYSGGFWSIPGSAPYTCFGGGCETCDDGAANSPTERCNTNCTLTVCGDRVIQPFAPRYEQCEPFNDTNCNSNCRYSDCGDSIIGIGEECDNGGLCDVVPNACINDAFCVANGYGNSCVPQDGDGCSAFCMLTDCDVNSVTTSCPPGQICGKNDKINVTVQYSGTSCNKANTVQVDYTNAYGNCKIQFKPVNLNTDMQGMNHSFSSLIPSPFKYTYTIPSIPNGCAGQNLANVTAAFYQSNGVGLDILRSNTYYRGTTPNITLDQCKQYGVVSNYTNSGVNSGIKVINNSNTGCYYYTCDNYAATSIFVFNFSSGAGVRLKNKLYYCDALNEDFVCPDDFEYKGRCRQGESRPGVCESNGYVDVDCEAKTPMKCGITVNAYGTLIPSCNITLIPPTPPTKYCTNSSMCVYANETSGLNKTCMAFNSTRKNAEDHNIQCVSNNTWCPSGYLFNGTYCYNPNPQCLPNCTQASTVARFVGYPELLKKWSVWQRYLNNSGCFLTNATTGRRRAYCGVSYAWPEVQYNYLPIGVSYAHWDWGSGKYVQDGNVVPIIIYTTQ